MRAYIFVFITIASTAIGQFLVKAGVLKISGNPAIKTNLALVGKALLQPMILGGLALAFFASLSWIIAMRTLPLSYAYPFTALTVVVVTLISKVAFNESFSILYWVSIALIVSGLLLLFKAQ